MLQYCFIFSMLIKQFLLLLAKLLCYIYVVPLVSSTLIASVANSFETFSPYATLRFFEFNDQGWLLSEHCLRDTYEFLDGLRRGTFWAFKLYDATSYYSGGGFGAMKQRFHNPNLCRELHRNYIASQKRGRRLEELNESVVPFSVHIIVATYVLEVANENTSSYNWEKIEQLICYPAACDSLDLDKIFELQYFQANTFVRNITYLKHRIVTDNFMPRHAGNIFKLISFLLIIFFLHFMVYSKGYLTNLMHAFKFQTTNIDVEKLQHKEGLNLPKIVNRRPDSMLLIRTLDALSVQNVAYNLLDDTDKSVLSGMFVIFGFCLIYAHVAVEINSMKNNSNIPIFEPKQQQFMKFIHKDVNYLFDVYFFVRYLPTYLPTYHKT